jgi:hypothetical protein
MSLPNTCICGLYYKPMAIINDDSKVIKKLEASLSDNARVIIYNCHMFIVQATGIDSEQTANTCNLNDCNKSLVKLAKPNLSNGPARFKNVNNCLNTNMYSYLETSGGQSYNLYLNVLIFSIQGLNRHLWHPKTVVLLHWCLICALL